LKDFVDDVILFIYHKHVSDLRLNRGEEIHAILSKKKSGLLFKNLRTTLAFR